MSKASVKGSVAKIRRRAYFFRGIREKVLKNALVRTKLLEVVGAIQLA